MARHNQRFAKVPFDPRDVHRPLAPHDDLRTQLVWREWRTVTQALALHYNKAMFILEPNEISRTLAGKRVEVCEYPDGGLEIRHGEHALPYRMHDKIRQVNQAAIVDNKHLDAALAMAKLMQEQLPPRKRAARCAPLTLPARRPRRRDCLARMAHGDAGADAALQQDADHS